MPAEKVHGGHGDQHKEVERHQQVVRNHGLRAQLSRSGEGVGHGGKVDRTADVGAGKHGGNFVQVGNKAVEHEKSNQCAKNGADRTDQKNDEQLAAFLADFFDIALEQKQGNCQRNNIVPYRIIYRGYGRNQSNVG